MTEHLRAYPVPAGATLPGEARETRQTFLRRCRRRARIVERGADLVGEGDEAPGALWVLSGRVGVRKTLDDGRSLLFDLLLPVDVLHPAGADLRASGFEASAMDPPTTRNAVT